MNQKKRDAAYSHCLDLLREVGQGIDIVFDTNVISPDEIQQVITLLKALRSVVLP